MTKEERKQYYNEWKIKNSEKLKSYKKKYNKDYKIKNKEKLKIYSREYNKKNGYRFRNPEKQKIYREKHRKEQKIYRKKYRELHQKEIKEKRILTHKLSLRFTVFIRDKFTCQYCGRNVKEDNIKLELDHIFPRSKGGKDTIENFITSCRDCNIGKFNKIIT